MEQIRFDDVEALRKKISAEFGPWSDEFEVTQKIIDDFAELTGDHQWIHTDVERARRESPFKTTVAHGFLTLSLLPRLSAATRQRASYAVVGPGNLLNYGSDKLRFLSPVPAGAPVRSPARPVQVEA